MEKQDANDRGSVTMLRIGRVKMRINDYILNNYAKLFFNGHSNLEGQDSKDDEYLTVSQETILSN